MATRRMMTIGSVLGALLFAFLRVHGGPLETYLPKEVRGFLKVENMSEMVEDWPSSTVGRLWEDERLRAFLPSLASGDFVETFAEELGGPRARPPAQPAQQDERRPLANRAALQVKSPSCSRSRLPARTSHRSFFFSSMRRRKRPWKR